MKLTSLFALSLLALSCVSAVAEASDSFQNMDPVVWSTRIVALEKKAAGRIFEMASKKFGPGHLTILKDEVTDQSYDATGEDLGVRHPAPYREVAFYRSIDFKLGEKVCNGTFRRPTQLQLVPVVVECQVDGSRDSDSAYVSESN